jgi:segregation and condensation protein A
MSFRVDLSMFRGPMDLLLYLVRKHEVDVKDIPIALVTKQYLGYIEVLQQLDINAVAEFLDLASTLIEIKSRMVLPRGDEVEEEMEDPRQELVRRLLEYKKYRDAASMLEDQSREWQQRYTRQSDDLPPRERNLGDEPIHEVELWDLVSAFGRIMRETAAVQPSNIVYDDTPIHVYMQQLNTRLHEEGHLAFSDMFEPDMHKSTLVGIFLAILELVRHHGVRVEQNDLFGEIWLMPSDNSGPELDLFSADAYDPEVADSEEP